MGDIRDRTAKSIFWQMGERVSAEAVTLLVSIILARILLPEDYGTIAMIQVFISFFSVFVTNGFSAALIQKKDADKLDFYSSLYSSFVLGLVIYSILFALAPLIAAFYDNDKLVWVLRFLSLQIPVVSVKSIEQAYLAKRFQFKSFFYATLVGTVISAIIGISMALHGYGVWSLCAQTLSNYTIDTIVLAFLIGKPLRLIFSFKRVLGLFDFSIKMLFAGLINSFYSSLKHLVIGKIYTASDLSFFNRGEQFPSLIATNVTSSIESVFFPTLSLEQDNLDTVKRLTRRFVKVSTYLMFPMFTGLAAIADTLIHFILSDKWTGCVVYLQIFCVVFLFNPMQIATIQPIKAMGNAKLYLECEIIRKVVGFSVILLVMNCGVIAIAFASLGLSIFNWIVNSVSAAMTYHYSLLEQLKDFVMNFILALLMGGGVLLVKKIPCPIFLILFMQLIIGVVLYLVLSILTKNESFFYLLKYLTDRGVLDRKHSL